MQCYAHIINICCSHIVTSITSTSKSYLSNLKVPIDSNHATHDNSDDNLESGESKVDPSCDFDKPELANLYDNEGDARLKEWSSSIKRDPVRHAQRIVYLLQSLDQHREGFCNFIKDGNRHGWFTTKDNDGKCIIIKVLELQPLRDVKARWDLVFMMLQHL
jgi:hypothetical protein